MTRRPIRTSEEQDVYTGWRHLLAWTSRPGATRRVKRRTHRRERREARGEIDAQLDDERCLGRADTALHVAEAASEALRGGFSTEQGPLPVHR